MKMRGSLLDLLQNRYEQGLRVPKNLSWLHVNDNFEDERNVAMSDFVTSLLFIHFNQANKHLIKLLLIHKRRSIRHWAEGRLVFWEGYYIPDRVSIRK